MLGYDLEVAYEASLRAVVEFLSERWSATAEPGPVPWIIFSIDDDPLPQQGWKLHLSVAAIEAVSMCESVLPELVRLKLAFKVPATVHAICALNAGRWGESQIGKILTVYPRNDLECQSAVTEISRVWRESLGPRVPSDLIVQSAKGLYIRYGSFREAPIGVDRVGRYMRLLVRPDGTSEPDRRKLGGKQPGWVGRPPVPCRKQPLKSLESNVNVARQAFLPLATLHKSPKGTVRLALNLNDGRTVVLKSALHGFGGDTHGMDAADRLKNEGRILDYLARTAPNISPRPLGFVSSKSTGSVLAMEDIQSSEMSQETDDDVIDFVCVLARTVAELHKAGVVHNDIKPANLLCCSDGIKLIDFELGQRMDEARRFFGGTAGYARRSVDATSESNDVYAVGVCFAQLLTGADPSALPQPQVGRLIGILRATGRSWAIPAVIYATGSIKPTLSCLVNALARERETDRRRSTRNRQATDKDRRRRLQWATSAPAQAIVAAREFVRSHPAGYSWENGHHNLGFQCEAINIGAAGIALALATVDDALGRNDSASAIAATADWLAAKPPMRLSPGLYTGDAGVALVLSLLSRRIGRRDLLDAASERLYVAIKTAGELPTRDLFSGQAGVVFAACMMSRILRLEWPATSVQGLVDLLVVCL
jgi:hypothetical protein